MNTLNEALAYLDRHRGAGDRVDALIDSLEKFLKARADVRDDDGSDPTV